MTESDWRTAIYAVLRHPKEKKILMITEGDSWRLPAAIYEGKLWVAQAGIAVEAISAFLKTDVWMLRQLEYQVLKEVFETTAVYEFELLDHDWKPSEGSRWVELEAFRGLDFTPITMQETVLAYLKGLESEAIPAARAPWSLPGWRLAARTWIEARLSEHDVTLEAMEQVKHWGISAVIRLKTHGENFYFKAPQTSQTLFANEARLTTCLASLFPGWAPVPLAVDPDRDWLLFHDFGDTDTWNTPLETRVGLFRAFARLQIESVDHIDRLLEAGCLDRRLPVLSDQIDPLLESQEATARLAPEKRAALPALSPVLKDLCDRLAAYNVPETLVHGDLHLGNALVDRPGFTLYDWTDACIAHPFLDLSYINREKDQDAVDQILRAYLETWQDFETMARLREMWPIAHILAMLHQAISYQHIVENLEPDSKKEPDFTHLILNDILEAVQVFQNQAGRISN